MSQASLPERIATEEQLEDLLSTPPRELVDDWRAVEGDLLVLGCAGKVGPTLCRMAKRAAPEKRVLGVARFREPGLRDKLAAWGIETLVGDLTDRRTVEGLPRFRNVVFMAGRKFGTTGDEPFTWLMNAYVPGLVGEVFQGSRIVAFSTLCVYPFAPVPGPGWAESQTPAPPGEYANSCVGRERLIQYFTQHHGTSGRLVRLNYAIEMRYGVLHDLARRILADQEIALATGYVNILWQGDATAQILRSFRHTTSPAAPLNIGGPRNEKVRELAEALGERLGRPPRFTGTEAAEAWANDTHLAQQLFGPPRVPVERMLAWTADWLRRKMPHFEKPTRYEERSGQF